MDIGFYTSTFGDRPVGEVLDFAQKAGFDAVELDVGSHIGDASNLAAVVEKARTRDLDVSSVALFGNQLNPDSSERDRFRKHTREIAIAAAEADVPALVIFPGRDNSISDDANYENFASYVGDLLDANNGVGPDILFENWPGPNNDFIATTPRGMAKIFDLIRSEKFGFEFDPSHLLRIGVDPFAAFEQVASRVKIIHAKDCLIHANLLDQVGYHGKGWWEYRLPGNGVLDWPRFLRLVIEHKFDGPLSIEHEDAAFGWPRGDVAARYDGERLGIKALKDALKSIGHS